MVIDTAVIAGYRRSKRSFDTLVCLRALPARQGSGLGPEFFSDDFPTSAFALFVGEMSLRERH